MKIIAIIFYGILTAIVMAFEGDMSGIKKIGEILIYVVLIGLVLWFLSVTGVVGLVLIVVICLIISATDSFKNE